MASSPRVLRRRQDRLHERTSAMGPLADMHGEDRPADSPPQAGPGISLRRGRERQSVVSVGGHRLSGPDGVLVSSWP